MALYIPHSIFHLARLLYVRPETFGPYYVCCYNDNCITNYTVLLYDIHIFMLVALQGVYQLCTAKKHHKHKFYLFF